LNPRIRLPRSPISSLAAHNACNRDLFRKRWTWTAPAGRCHWSLQAGIWFKRGTAPRAKFRGVARGSGGPIFSRGGRERIVAPGIDMATGRPFPPPRARPAI
jgi:hypothetical protein